MVGRNIVYLFGGDDINKVTVNELTTCRVGFEVGSLADATYE